MPFSPRTTRQLIRILISAAVLSLFATHITSSPRFEVIDRMENYLYDVRVRLTMPGGVDDVSQGLNVPEAELARLIVRLELQGTIDLGTRTALDEALGDLGARVQYLDVDDAKLAVEPTEDDLDTIDTAGFVRTGMERLREELNGPEAETARRALALLYGLHQKTGG